MTSTFESKTFLVTGCNSGIGRATLMKLVKEGAYVIGVARDEARLQEVRDVCGEKVKLFSMDLTDDEALQNLVDKCDQLSGIIHCAASVDVLVPIRNLNLRDWDQTLKINLTVPVMLTQKLLKRRALLNQASVVFVSSIAAQRPQRGQLIYGVTKAGIENAIKCFAKEFASNKIRFNAIAPGLVHSEVFRKSLGTSIDPQDVENYRKRYPLDFGQIEDVVGSIIFLLDDSSQWMTGQTMTLDGGYTTT